MTPPKGYADLASLPEHERIAVIVDYVTSTGSVAGFFVDDDTKADRYIRKILRSPRCRIDRSQSWTWRDRPGQDRASAVVKGARTAMGYITVIGECVGCHQVFSFNPDRVPSLRRTPDGPREPICPPCVERANAMRRLNGHPLIVVLPGAYDAADEHGEW